VTFSPGGRRCAATEGDKAIRIFELESGQATLISHPHTAPITALAFSPDGERLASSSDDRAAKVWDATTGHEALVLRLHSARISSVAFSPDGRRLATACELIDVCDAGEPEGEGRAARAHEAEARAPQWHLAQVYACEKEGNGLAAIHHLDQLIAWRPGWGDLHGWRANHEAQLRRWERASAGLARAIELEAEGSGYYYRAALVRLRERDLAAYRAVCAAAARRFGRARDQSTLNELAWTCSLGPGALEHAERSVRWASAAVALAPRSANDLNTLGAALYRAGQFEEAIRRLDEAITIRGREGTEYDRLLLAMAHARAGRRETARTWLARAVAGVERPKRPAPPGSDDPELPPWAEEVELELLRREAEALILAPDLPADPFAP
jgi:tetratricopeptide (TPR) repeat protein